MCTEDIKEIIEAGENQYVEFKREITSPDDLASEMVAFLNSEGGAIYIGVEDNGNIIGVKDSKRLKERIVGISRNNCVPHFVPEFEDIKMENLKLLRVNVPRGKDKPYCSNKGLYYTRVGNTRQRASKEELGRLFQVGGYVHVDIQPVEGTTLADLNIHRIEEYFESVHHIDINRSEIDLERILRNSQILTEKGETTLGGTLLFSDNPGKYIFQSVIMLVKYDGKELGGQILKKENIDMPLPDAIDKAIDFVMKSTKSIFELEGGKRVERTEYPLAVIKEAVTNAIAHRNYGISGSRIRIFIFDDRIEVLSPGRLPNTVTLEQIRYGATFSRNQFIVKLLNNYRYIETLGQGIPMMIREMLDHSGREPVFEEVGEEFRVTLFGKKPEQ